MINLLLLLFFLTCIGITAAWIAENPGYVTIHWFDYRIDTSFAFMLLLSLLSAVLLAYAYLLLRNVILMPSYLSRRRKLHHYQKGLTELTHSVAALAAADPKEAEKHTRKAEKLLGRTPLTLLLGAQIARSKGDEETTRMLLTQMLEHKETEYLAARSLSDVASKKHLYPQALALAQRAQSLHPGDIAALVSLHIRLGQWQQALAAIDKATRKGKLTRNQRRRYRGLIYLQQGLQLQETAQPEAAFVAARHSLRELPEFPPNVAFAAQAFAAQGKKNSALRMIFHAWKHSPHPQLAEALRIVMAHEPKAKQMKLVRKLATITPESIESHLAVAQIAIWQLDWQAARQSLDAAMAIGETAHTCRLMADVEQGDFSNFDTSGKWIARSTTAAADPTWICSNCGHASSNWDSHCHSCESFDTLEWKKRDIAFVG